MGIRKVGIVVFSTFFSITSISAQQLWHLDAPVLNKSFGVDAHGAGVLLKDKQPSPVIVAVIDNGAQTTHKYLQPNVWVNKGEIPGNGKDDDGNDYVDDVNGWSFLGGKGGDINYEADEKTRLYFKFKQQYTDTTGLSAIIKDSLDQATKKYNDAQKSREAQAKTAGKMYDNRDAPFMQMVSRLTMGKNYESQIVEFKEMADGGVLWNSMNADSARGAIVGDDPDDSMERHYGNNHVDAANPAHGTHTAGIVAGVARCAGNGTWLQIMPIRAIPNGDERDKDVANAIRYAVDNGAKVINMSFGKYASQHPQVVRDAIVYAQQKDVLLVHGCGNEASNLTDWDIQNYPNAFIDSNTRAANFISVGATGRNRKRLMANFSNYGRKDVDVLAPGVDIYSSVPVDTFEKYSGTSMSAPVVAGVAAILRSYYPHLSAAQVKDILMQSVTHHTVYSRVPGSRGTEAQLWYFCRSAGIVNAATAVKQAASR